MKRKHDIALSKYPAAAQRLNDVLTSCNMTQERAAEIAGVTPTAISRYCTGQRKMPDACYAAIAQNLGLRVEYLKGIDNFKTDSEINAAAKQNDADYMESHIRYLESIGYIVHRRVELYVWNLATLVKHWDAIRATLTDEALQFRCTPDCMTIGEWDGSDPADLCAARDEYMDPLEPFPDNWDGYALIGKLFNSGIPVKSTLRVLDHSDRHDCSAFYDITYILQYNDTMTAYSQTTLSRAFETMDDHARVVIKHAAY